MVDQSDLAFRRFCRAHGCRLAYSPMLYAKVLLRDRGRGLFKGGYFGKFFKTCPSDRPLAIQLAGNNANMLASAAALVAEHCDVVDLNIGCPQNMARAGARHC